jgi:Arc/MetJ-type ribon-helix-helix transcriptional regulator
MKVVVDVPDGLMQQVREAVQQGEYEDAREFVTIALENQAELELDDDEASDVMTLEQAIESEAQQPRTDGHPVITSSSSDGVNALKRLEYDLVATVSSPDYDRLDAGPLWGQYNRIFPVKLTLRVLANELRNQAVHTSSQVDGSGAEWVSLDRFSQKAAEIAREYGMKIKQTDNNKSRGQGEKLSAALPVGDDPEKSKKRFKSHFVGDIDQQGGLSGAPAHLLFVNIPSDSPGLIDITEAGLEFASKWNPLIDGGVSSDQALSEDEAEFYLRHVEEQLPEEFNAMTLTAAAIEDGHNRPTSLTERIASINSDWSEAQASTIRAGLVSRMYELDLVDRERVGQRGIAYKLTENGHKFAANKI